MGRNISLGANSQYIEKSEQVVQINYSNIENKCLPEKINEEQWGQLLEVLKQFLVSDECKDLRSSDYERVKNEIEILKVEPPIRGWQKTRDFLADGANLVTIVPPLTTFILAHGDKIALWIKNLFEV